MLVKYEFLKNVSDTNTITKRAKRNHHVSMLTSVISERIDATRTRSVSTNWALTSVAVKPDTTATDSIVRVSVKILWDLITF